LEWPLVEFISLTEHHLTKRFELPNTNAQQSMQNHSALRDATLPILNAVLNFNNTLTNDKDI
jgi:hypothetical protein